MELIIDKRFCGPPNSGNGGYVCGRLANHIQGASEVTLWQPPPLNRILHIDRDGDTVRLLDRDSEPSLLAEAKAVNFDFDVPEAISYKAALRATENFVGFDKHPFPGCFVCGTQRGLNDGLRVFAGAVSEKSLVAATWKPDASLVDDSGEVKKEFLWSALDCPGAFATLAWSGQAPAALLGRFTAHVYKSVFLGDECIVQGWPIEHSGRKHIAGTALFDKKGEKIAIAKAIWIEPKATYK